jgi:hypothetical protein
LIFLGDNIYKAGLPAMDTKPIEEDKQCKYRACAESRINVQIALLKNPDSQGIFIPGNHDWNKQGKGGWERIINQGEYIESMSHQYHLDVRMLPKNACPGPYKVVLTGEDQLGGVALIVLDTQWWLHSYDKPDINHAAGCDPVTKDGVIMLLQQQLEIARKNHRKIIVVGHHVLESNGNHGGNLPLNDWFNPLTVVSQLINRTEWAHPQYLAHPIYKEMRLRIEQVFQEAVNKGLAPIIYASGHDHSLQILKLEQKQEAVIYVVSGLGSGTNHSVGHDTRSLFSYVNEKGGFMVLDYLENNKIRIAVIVPDNNQTACDMSLENCVIFSRILN